MSYRQSHSLGEDFQSQHGAYHHRAHGPRRDRGAHRGAGEDARHRHQPGGWRRQCGPGSTRGRSSSATACRAGISAVSSTCPPGPACRRFPNVKRLGDHGGGGHPPRCRRRQRPRQPGRRDRGAHAQRLRPGCGLGCRMGHAATGHGLCPGVPRWRTSTLRTSWPIVPGVGAELGADVVKVNYPGDPESFARVVELHVRARGHSGRCQDGFHPSLSGCCPRLPRCRRLGPFRGAQRVPAQ